MSAHPNPNPSRVVRLLSPSMRRIGEAFSARSFALGAAAALGLPVIAFDHFRVSLHSFGPHPHAGFSAVSYVLHDSPGGLRSRDSLGGDVVVGPGGMVWMQAGSGALHEELQAQPGLELRGLQVFVNLPASHKMIAPQVMYLDGPQVPEWRGPAGDRVRVLVGQFDACVSPLRPAQPLRWLDVQLQEALEVDLPQGHVLLAYLLEGQVQLQLGPDAFPLAQAQALVLADGGQAMTWKALAPSRILLLSGPALHEPRVGEGPFVMADAGQWRDAVRRYHAGEMGQLEPCPPG